MPRNFSVGRIILSSLVGATVVCAVRGWELRHFIFGLWGGFAYYAFRAFWARLRAQPDAPPDQA